MLPAVIEPRPQLAQPRSFSEMIRYSRGLLISMISMISVRVRKIASTFFKKAPRRVILVFADQPLPE